MSRASQVPRQPTAAPSGRTPQKLGEVPVKVRMSELGHLRQFGDVGDMSAIAPIATEMVNR